MDQNTDSENGETAKEIAPKAVKIGAALGMTAGWLIGLITVSIAFSSASFGQQGTVDGILLAAPMLGAAVGAGIGWLLRDSEWFARLTLPPWATRKQFKWGWKAGTVAGLGLAQSYIAAHSPLGFYTGSTAAVFELIVPFCAALGAGIGWLSSSQADKPA